MVLSNGFFYERIQLDTINERFNKVPTAKEGDANGRGMIVVLTENGLVKNTTGVTLLFKWEHTRIAGAQGLEYFEPLDLTKGEYIVTYPTEMNHEGYVKAEIRIIDNGKYAGSRNMKIQVEPSVGDDTAMESSNQFSALVTALMQVNSWNTTIDGKIVDWEADMAATKQLYIDNMEEVESTYPIELNSVKQQLEQASAQVDLLNRGLGETFATLTDLQTAYPTGDTKDHIVGADGHRYYWNDTAWADGGAYQAVELKNKSVFNPNLSQPLQDYFELYKSYKNVGVSYTGTSDPGNRTWYGLAMLCHSVAVFTKIGIRLTPLNLMGTEYTAELRSGDNFNTLLATATGVKQTNGYEFVTFDFGKDFYGDVYVCIKTADGKVPSLDASFLNTSMVTTTDKRYNIESTGGAWGALSGGYNAYLKIDFYTDEYVTEAQNLLSRVRQVESDISMFQNDFFSPLIQTILGIGDSLTAGAYDLNALTTTIYPNASYLAMINRLKNVAIVNKGSSGSTTNDYRTLHDADIVACNASAVVIWLGVNDVLKGANAFNGSVADVQGSDYTLYPNTSAGNLGYIIKRAKARNPNAKIFVCNMLKWFNGGPVVTNLNAANVTIAAVADYLDTYLIDLNTLSGLSYALNRNQCFGINGVHLTEYGYAMIANTVTNVISDVIKNNPTDFRYTNMALN